MFWTVKTEKIRKKRKIFFLIFAQNIDFGSSNVYPQSMFWIENKKIRAVAGQRSSPDLCFATKSIKIYDP